MLTRFRSAAVYVDVRLMHKQDDVCWPHFQRNQLHVGHSGTNQLKPSIKNPFKVRRLQRLEGQLQGFE